MYTILTLWLYFAIISRQSNTFMTSLFVLILCIWAFSGQMVNIQQHHSSRDQWVLNLLRSRKFADEIIYRRPWSVNGHLDQPMYSSEPGIVCFSLGCGVDRSHWTFDQGNITAVMLDLTVSGSGAHNGRCQQGGPGQLGFNYCMPINTPRHLKTGQHV